MRERFAHSKVVGELRRNEQAERGQALPLFAITFVAIVGFAGLALDGSRLYAEHARLQAAADAAAIGAAHELRRGHVDYSRNLLPAALHDAALQGVDDTEAEIIVHHPPVSGAFADSQDHVEVVVRGDFRTTFMAMFGAGTRPVSGRAVAGLAAGQPPCLSVLGVEGPDAFVVEGSQPFDVDCEVARADAVDPFAGLRMPSCAGRPAGSIQPSETGDETLHWPGCYEEAVAIVTGKVRLMPGVHIYLRGLRVAGGFVDGDGVSLLFPASDEQQGITVANGAQVTLRAPVQGELAGILLFGEAGEAIVARAAGSDLQGALYFPGRALRWAPNAPDSSSWTQAVADKLVILEAPDGRAVFPAPDGASASYAAVLVE